ncbi:MAG: hypothetical protein HYZ53_21475 [Planctomycetes bacterium]|nr:hypothetical protein [Planctomycetota bacterium]
MTNRAFRAPILFGSLCLLLTLVAGCGKDEPATPAAPPSAAPPTTAPAAADLRNVSPLSNPVEYYDRLNDAKAKLLLSQGLEMTKERIMTFQVKNGRYPKSLEELKPYGDPLPLPAGCEYKYDAATGVLEIVMKGK